MMNFVKWFEMPWEKWTNFEAGSNFKIGHAGGAGRLDQMTSRGLF